MFLDKYKDFGLWVLILPGPEPVSVDTDNTL